ncbi:hypothetical protein PGIGA_G00070600, partial [Pangasianodon gigas]|nr:hypothetical protein [Pangasianodon gigas]
MVNNSRRSRQVPLSSAKNRNLRLSWAQTLDGRRLEKRHLVQHAEGRVRIWHQRHESMNPT